MNNSSRSLLIATIIAAGGLSLGTASTFAGKDYLGANYTSYSGFSVSEKMEAPAEETHPSLWFSQEELQGFKAHVQNNKELEKLWLSVKNSRFVHMEMPNTVRIQDGKVAIHKYYGDMTQIALYNAFMVWMSDPADREHYRNRAVKALLRTYDGPVYKLDPNKKGVDKAVDEIYRGVWNQSIAAAYDFIHPFLSKKEDELIRNRLIREAQYNHKHLHTWAKGPHNHLSKPAWGLASLALTLSDHPQAKDWFKHAINAANKNTRYHFSDDGIYREGAQYYLFSWLNYVPFLYHYKNVSNVDLFGTFQSSMEWSLKARNGRGWMMNLEDSFIRPIPTQMVAAPYMNYRSELNPDVPFGELLQWGYETTDFEPFDKVEEESSLNYTGASWDYPKELYELITYRPEIEGAAPSSDPTIFMDGGQSVFRNQWLDADKQQQYLLFHGVPHADNHDHHDQLSFVLYAEGQMMASDQGYTRKSYGEDIRYSWYRTAHAHNTLTLDDVPLGDFVENQPAPSKDRINTSFFDFEQKSAPFKLYLGKPKGSAERAIAYIQDDYFLVLDSVKANRDGKFSLRYHGGRSSIRSLGDQLFWLYKDDQYGSKSALMTQSFSHGANQQFLSGEGTYIKSDYTEIPFLQLDKSARETQFAQLLFPVNDQSGIPTIENLSNDQILAASIQSTNNNDIFMKQLKNDVKTVKSMKTDARFSWIRTDENSVKKLFAQSFTELDWNNEKFLRLSSPASVAIQIDQQSLSGGYSTSSQTQIGIFGIEEAIEKITVNNQVIPFQRNEKGIQFSLNGEGDFKVYLKESSL